jgi:hypothetical protein
MGQTGIILNSKQLRLSMVNSLISIIKNEQSDLELLKPENKGNEHRIKNPTRLVGLKGLTEVGITSSSVSQVSLDVIEEA